MTNKRTLASDRIIGARLRAIRTVRTKLNLEEAAKTAQWAPARLSRTENGERQVTIAEAATLLTAYDIPVAEREEVIAQFKSGIGSWERGLPNIPLEAGALASYERTAIELVDVSPLVVPSLLQTYATARAILAASRCPQNDIEGRWMARQHRQRILGTVDYTAYISHGALYTPFGGRAAHRAQLTHLAGAPDRGIGVRIVPERQTKILLVDTWHWMRFTNAAPTVCIEMTSGAQFLHDKDAEPYTSNLHRIKRLALSTAASQDLITELLFDLDA